MDSIKEYMDWDHFYEIFTDLTFDEDCEEIFGVYGA